MRGAVDAELLEMSACMLARRGCRRLDLRPRPGAHRGARPRRSGSDGREWIASLPAQPPGPQGGRGHLPRRAGRQRSAPSARRPLHLAATRGPRRRRDAAPPRGDGRRRAARPGRGAAARQVPRPGGRHARRPDAAPVRPAPRAPGLDREPRPRLRLDPRRPDPAAPPCSCTTPTPASRPAAWACWSDATEARPLYTDGLALATDLLRRWPGTDRADERAERLERLAAYSCVTDWDSVAARDRKGGPVELTFLDARQGDAIWVRWGEGRQLLVDMGTSGTGRGDRRPVPGAARGRARVRAARRHARRHRPHRRRPDGAGRSRRAGPGDLRGRVVQRLGAPQRTRTRRRAVRRSSRWAASRASC